MQSTRQEVIRALKTLGPATVSEIARFVGVKGITIRHHVNALQAEGVVRVDERRQQVGRPVHVIQLTEQPYSSLPVRYHHLVEHLFEQIKRYVPGAEMGRVVDEIAEAIAADMRQHIGAHPPEARAVFLTSYLESQGITVQHRHTDEAEVVEFLCPYHTSRQHHPELCRADRLALRKVLGDENVREYCQSQGDEGCMVAWFRNRISLTRSLSAD
ncbi:MAG: ArsR family transcriptional regulator [Anaerolineae bacterium]|nr:ArsR family transcriptional regulator [Anaerolineae bacterium]